jgi:phosphoglycolate phosphatase
MKAFFFDLDGTLTDSRPGLNLSFRAALRALGLPDMSDSEAAAYIGSPLPEAFRLLNPQIAQADVLGGMAAFRAAYEQEGIVQNLIYPGVIDLLQDIERRGAISCVVTSKPEHYAVRVVEIIGIKPYLKGLVGADLAETETKTTLVARALSAVGVAASDALMLGDRRHDVIGALENGVLPVGALWGYGTLEELQAAGCRSFAGSPPEFHRLFVTGETASPAAPAGDAKSLKA